MAHAIFYMRQTSAAYAGVCTCDCMYQMEMTAPNGVWKKQLSDSNQNVLIHYHEYAKLNLVGCRHNWIKIDALQTPAAFWHLGHIKRPLVYSLNSILF